MKIFILTYKESEEKRYYTTLSALCEENSKEQIKVSLSTLQKRGADLSFFYENDSILIETAVVKTKGDIIRERENII